MPIPDVEDQVQCSFPLAENSRGPTNDYDNFSPDLAVGSSSGIEEDDKDNFWMQFITEDAWCSTLSSGEGAYDSPCVTSAT